MRETAAESSRKGANGHPVKEKLQSAVEEIRQKTKETGRQVVDETGIKARRLFAEQRNALAGQIEGFAKAFRDTGGNLEEHDFKIAARYSTEVAGEVDRLAEFIREKDMSEIIDSVEDLGRRQPAIFYGGMFAAGLLLARFLKSSAQPEANLREAESRAAELEQA